MAPVRPEVVQKIDRDSKPAPRTCRPVRSQGQGSKARRWPCGTPLKPPRNHSVLQSRSQPVHRMKGAEIACAQKARACQNHAVRCAGDMRVQAASRGQTHLASRRPCGAHAVEIDGRAAPRRRLNLLAHHIHGGGLLEEGGEKGHLRGAQVLTGRIQMAGQVPKSACDKQKRALVGGAGAEQDAYLYGMAKRAPVGFSFARSPGRARPEQTTCGERQFLGVGRLWSARGGARAGSGRAGRC